MKFKAFFYFYHINHLPTRDNLLRSPYHLESNIGPHVIKLRQSNLIS